MKRQISKNQEGKSLGYMAGRFTVLLIMLVITLLGCKRTATESTSTQLTQLSAFYKLPWPTNYFNDYAGTIKYPALDYQDNTIALTRLQTDKTNFHKWYIQVTNKMEEYEEFGALVKPEWTKKFPWYNPQVYPDKQVTLYFYQTNPPPDCKGKLCVYTIKTNDFYIMFIESRISK
jgi:hypothetical protein